MITIKYQKQYTFIYKLWPYLSKTALIEKSLNHIPAEYWYKDRSCSGNKVLIAFNLSRIVHSITLIESRFLPTLTFLSISEWCISDICFTSRQLPVWELLGCQGILVSFCWLSIYATNNIGCVHGCLDIRRERNPQYICGLM